MQIGGNKTKQQQQIAKKKKKKEETKRWDKNKAAIIPFHSPTTSVSVYFSVYIKISQKKKQTNRKRKNKELLKKKLILKSIAQFFSSPIIQLFNVFLSSPKYYAKKKKRNRKFV